MSNIETKSTGEKLETFDPQKHVDEMEEENLSPDESRYISTKIYRTVVRDIKKTYGEHVSPNRFITYVWTLMKEGYIDKPKRIY